MVSTWDFLLLTWGVMWATVGKIENEEMERMTPPLVIQPVLVMGTSVSVCFATQTPASLLPKMQVSLE